MYLEWSETEVRRRMRKPTSRKKKERELEKQNSQN
jgi:hypothetical protein